MFVYKLHKNLYIKTVLNESALFQDPLQPAGTEVESMKKPFVPAALSDLKVVNKINF